MEHRVLAHLGLAARDYDAAIRRYIPGYEQMVDTIVALVAKREAPYVIDLGAGTGALGGAIAERVPTARVRLLDIDPAMLEVAGARTEAHRDRVELHRGAFEDELPPCDVVVASLALHHIPERAAKTAVFARIRAALRPGGAVLIGDAVVDTTGPERDEMFAQWAAHMGRHGIAPDEAAAHFAQWATEDSYYPLRDELAMLAEAGFPRPDCFWKAGPIAVYGAFVVI